MTKERAVTLSLPIFRKVQDLCSLMIDVQRDMQKQYKHSVGERMLDESLSLMKSIFAINRAEKTSSERLTLMDGFVDGFDYLKSLVRIAEEKRVITIKQQSSIAVLMESINAQMTGWRRSTESLVCQDSKDADRSEP